MNRTHLFNGCAAALAALIASPASAQTSLSIGGLLSREKHEFQGSQTGHFSMTDRTAGFTIGIIQHDVFQGGFDLSYNLSIHEQHNLETQNDTRRWVRATGTQLTAQTSRLGLTLWKELVEGSNWCIDGGASLGLARTHAKMQVAGTNARNSETVPFAELSVRHTQKTATDISIWSQATYHTSPQVTFDFGSNRLVKNEISGFQLGAGISIALN
jgi:hypothetical protein